MAQAVPFLFAGGEGAAQLGAEGEAFLGGEEGAKLDLARAALQRDVVGDAA